MRVTTTLLVLVLTLSFSAMGSGVKIGTDGKKWKVQKVEANLDEGCRFAAELPVTEHAGVFTRKNPPRGGMVVKPLPKSWNGRGLEDLYFQLMCLDADKILNENSEASFDPQTETWGKDIEKRIKALGYRLSPQEYRSAYEDFDKAIRVYNVTAVNAKGFVSIEDDTTGDEKGRMRHMGFCFINRLKALCGEGVVGYVSDGPKSDLTERALEIIRTIEFLPNEE